ncbi:MULTISPECIES: glycoside hydrolase family 3 C-terminal domain-containing protein [unclassified Micromonospora]|uniref:glycoside hydrolase family 3 C-terminal domain-containing protein n=1 Tax=unclassified Micromonospora TaxID=2617518 RepID=UPI00362A21AA
MTDLDIARLLAELTLPEKAALLGGSDFWHTTAVERRGVPAVMLTDGPHGLRKQSSAADHLGLADSVPATCFPPAAGLASTWNTELVTRVGVALGRECRAEGVAVLLGPGVNMKRSPLCGRNFEYFAEDPVLAGELGAALVAGIQSQGVGASVKHFAANNQETDRMTVSAEVDERTLREIYLPAFERIVTRARPWTVMCSYNRINGVYASEHRWLLTDVLRDEWGFDGLVVSDWGAVNERDRAVHAGLDLEMPASGGVGATRIVEAVRSGALDEAAVDLAVTRVLRLLERVSPGLADRRPYDADAHHRLAREAATQSAVLLRNEGGLLPLARTGGPVAVIGEIARTPRYQGAGSSQVNPTRLDDALAALRAALGGRREVTFAPGYRLDADQPDPALVEEAVARARGAAVAVVFLGLPASYESEGYDRDSLELPPHQVTLVERIAEVNDSVVVVLANGGVVAVEPWHRRVRAVLEGWLLGQAGGGAIADLLLGRANPSGRLAETIPVRYADNPTVGAFPGENGTVRYGEGLLIGYRWYDAHELPVAYPFGHGLSYTSFAYGRTHATVRGTGQQTTVEVGCAVTNTGDRAGFEVVQVYVTARHSSVYRPPQELKAFVKVWLEPGETVAARVTLTARDLSYWDTAHRRWVIESGDVEIRVGASSRDIRATATVAVAGEDLTRPVTVESLAGQWLAHPVLGPRLDTALRTRPDASGLGAMLVGEQANEMIRAIPLNRLVRFPGFPVSDAEVSGWLAEAEAGER